MNFRVRQLCAVIVAVLTTATALPALAADVCAAPIAYRLLAEAEGGIGGSGLTEGGMGGTGRTVDAGSVGEGGIGGTGHAISGVGEGGIGGTGRTTDEGGVGGTGHTTGEGGVGGTGIVGTITGFASICVNGLEVHYDPAVPVSSNGEPSTVDALAIGQIVAVQARSSARGLQAERIALLNALEGPVTRAADATGQIEVMGARVAPVAASLRTQTAGLHVGDWVQVSGHAAANGGVLASRIARINSQVDASVSGAGDTVARQVGGVAVDRPVRGDVTVRGYWDGARLAVRENSAMAGSHWSSRLDSVVIETRVRERTGQTIRTGRADVDAALAGRPDHGGDTQLKVGTLIRMTARVDADGALRPTRIELGVNERRDRRGSGTSGSGHGGNYGGDNGGGTTDDSDGNGRSGGGDAGSDQPGSGDSGREGSTTSGGDDSHSGSGTSSNGSDGSSDRRIDGGDSSSVIRAESDGSGGGSFERDHGGHGDSVDHPDRVEKVEKIEKVEKVEKVDMPEKVERPEKVEKPENVERPDQVERPDRPDHSGPH